MEQFMIDIESGYKNKKNITNLLKKFENQVREHAKEVREKIKYKTTFTIKNTLHEIRCYFDFEKEYSCRIHIGVYCSQITANMDARSTFHLDKLDNFVGITEVINYTSSQEFLDLINNFYVKLEELNNQRREELKEIFDWEKIYNEMQNYKGTVEPISQEDSMVFSSEKGLKFTTDCVVDIYYKNRPTKSKWFEDIIYKITGIWGM